MKLYIKIKISYVLVGPNIIKCPLCESTKTKKIFSKKTLWYDKSQPANFKDQSFDHFRCKSCSFVFLPKPTELDIIKFYSSEYYDSFFGDEGPNVEKLFTNRLNEIIPLISGKKILDVGCPLGTSLKAFSTLNYEAYGMELSKTAVQIAKKQTKFDVIEQSIESITPWNDEFFDAITMCDVFEHLAQPTFALKEIRRILKKDGILYITTLNYGGIGRMISKTDWPLIGPPGHMSYWTKKTIVHLLKEFDFEIVKLRCFGITGNKKYLGRINSLLNRRFPTLRKLFELTGLGDYIELVVKKR